jgi:uncharacterized membrane protein HdeD (DUF308 family)
MSGSMSGNLGAPTWGWGGADPTTLGPALVAAPPEELTRARRLLLAVGIIALIAGVVAIVVPIVASVTMTLFIGWLLMFWGVLSLVHAIRTPAPRSAKAWRIFQSVVAVIAGFYLVVLPLSGTITLTFLLSAWFFAGGVVSLIAAWQHRHEPGDWIGALDGVLMLILGLLIALSLPSSAAWAIGLLVGVYMLWWGSGALVTAHYIKRLMRGELP